MFDGRELRCGFARNAEESLKSRTSPIIVEMHQRQENNILKHNRRKSSHTCQQSAKRYMMQYRKHRSVFHGVCLLFGKDITSFILQQIKNTLDYMQEKKRLLYSRKG